MFSTIYQVICTAFSVIVILANIISAKMVRLPLFDLSVPAGVIIYPITFLLSALVTEVFGAQKARFMVYMAFVMSILSIGIIQLALLLPANGSEEQGMFQTVMGRCDLRIFSSLIAYLVAQLIEIQLFSLIKRWTGAPLLWLRNNGSATLAQLIDTIVVDLIFLYWGMGMSFYQVLPVITISFLYKIVFSVANTPLLYLGIFCLGRQRSRINLSEKSPSF